MEIGLLMFAGVTALASGSSAYSAYRANHPRRQRTDQIANYTAAHAGYSMASPHRPVPQYYHLIHAPVYNVNYNQVTYINPPVRSQSYNYGGPSQQQLVPRPQPNRSASQPQPNRSVSQRTQPIRSVSQRPQPNRTVSQPQPNRSVSQRPQPNRSVSQPQPNRSVSQRTQPIPSVSQRPQPNRSVSQQVQPAGFGGTIDILKEQQAPDTYEDFTYGLSTGRRSGFTETNARNHWQSFQRGLDGHYGDSRTVAVLNWTKGEITMFVERDMTYFRNYIVSGCDVAGFAQQHRGNEMFSGIVKDGELVGSNHSPTIVEDDGECGFASSNCWTELGIPGPGVTDPVFVEMMRGAVFGLICCVHKKPSSLNVDMISGNGMDFVHVDGEPAYPDNVGSDCCFTVFSFLTDCWTLDLVLVG